MARKVNPEEPVTEVKEKKTKKMEVKAADVAEATDTEATTEEFDTDGSELESADNAAREFNPDELVARKTSRFTHELAKASQKVKKEMYRSEHVVTEFGDEEIETQSTILKKDYLELVASAKSNKILEGKIVGFRYAGDTRKSTVLAEIEFGSGLFNVLIPSYLIYDYEVSKYVEPDKIQIIENNIVRRIGGNIKFIVRHVDEKEKTAYADRLMAMSIIGYETYIKPTRDGKPRIVPGMLAKAQVMYTVSKGIIVDAFGAEILIRKEELSHSYVGDAREEFKVGDYVTVKIDKISEVTVEKNDTNYRLVKATGSVKAALVNNKANLFDQFKVDGIYAGTVSYVDESGVFCRLRGNMDCLVALPRFGANPVRGQSRLIRITEKDEDRLFLYGIFINN